MTAKIIRLPSFTSVATLRALRDDAAFKGRLGDARRWDDEMRAAEIRGWRLAAQQRERKRQLVALVRRDVADEAG